MSAVMDDLVMRVAAGLDGCWSWATKPTAAEPYAVLIGPGGERLHMWRTGDRFEVVGVRPYGTVGRDHQITVDADSPGEAIADAITRRLLPGYRVDLTSALAGLAAHVSDARRATAEAMSGVVPGATLTQGDLYLSWRDGRVTMNEDGTVDLTVRHLSATTAGAMLAAMVRGAL